MEELIGYKLDISLDVKSNTVPQEIQEIDEFRPINFGGSSVNIDID